MGQMTANQSVDDAYTETLAALAAMVVAAAPSSAGAADNEAQVLKGVESGVTVKLPAKSPGPDRFEELANGTETEAAAGVSTTLGTPALARWSASD